METLTTERITLNSMPIGHKRTGYKVESAAAGKEALSLYKKIRTEVTREIRKMEIKTGIHTLIIALTSNDASAKTECLAAGMDDFSTKPFHIEVLDRLIKGWLKNQ